MIRGSSEFAAMLSTAWGVQQIDWDTNRVRIANLRDRDFPSPACKPFELQGRPYINRQHDFELVTQPGDCEEQPDLRRGGGAPQAVRDAKTANKELLRTWLKADPDRHRPLDHQPLSEELGL